ncbi:MAG: hypothetical protein IMZ55_08790 [Acidobacteria bacterium]|nr:hypothetical protein [Acidobacteriota bacterium]
MKRQEATEERWTDDYRLFEADWDFRWARIRTLARWIAGRRVAGNLRSAASFVGELTGHARDGQGILRVPIDRIVGMVDVDGRKASPLPPLRRRHLAAWRRRYLGADLEATLELAVRAGEDGLYLVEADDALVTLEVARAKGHGGVRVRPDWADGSLADQQDSEQECPCAIEERAACCGA